MRNVCSWGGARGRRRAARAQAPLGGPLRQRAASVLSGCAHRRFCAVQAPAASFATFCPVPAQQVAAAAPAAAAQQLPNAYPAAKRSLEAAFSSADTGAAAAQNESGFLTPAAHGLGLATKPGAPLGAGARAHVQVQAAAAAGSI